MHPPGSVRAPRWERGWIGKRMACTRSGTITSVPRRARTSRRTSRTRMASGTSRSDRFLDPCMVLGTGQCLPSIRTQCGKETPRASRIAASGRDARHRPLVHTQSPRHGHHRRFAHGKQRCGTMVRQHVPRRDGDNRCRPIGVLRDKGQHLVPCRCMARDDG